MNLPTFLSSTIIIVLLSSLSIFQSNDFKPFLSHNSSIPIDTIDTPCQINWHTEDISKFWEIYENPHTRYNTQLWQTEYLDKGSAGLKSFIKNRIESAKNKDYYENIRYTSKNLDTYKKQVCKIYQKLDSLYPKAKFPDIYFVIGRRNTGGTISNAGLIIGIERFGVRNKNFNPDINIELLDDIIAHELIHFQQRYIKDHTLLAQCIREGSADFIGEMLSGSLANDLSHYKYGDAHEEALKQEFKKKMLSNDWTGWLYYQKDKSRPKDLGYWIGYKICQSYYQRASDKKQAIYDILNIQDFQKFLETSAYL
jgi:Predicted Zn-dependent protease (DUF2268)